MPRNSRAVFASIEREIYATERKKVGVVFSMKDVFCRKDKRYIKFKGLKKIFYFVRSLWYVPSQNKPKFLKKEEEILKIIKEYSPQIRQQCLDYEKYFFQWENANRRGECGISWYEKKELEAWDKADNLFKEEHKKLKEINGMIELFHPMSEKLKPGHEGWVSVKNSLEYLDFLEGFFDKRVKRLSK